MVSISKCYYAFCKFAQFARPKDKVIQMRYTTTQKSAVINGIKDSIPVALIYFIISFSFGVAVVNHGLPFWFATLVSATNLTSAGQFAGINLIVAATSYIEIAVTMLLINARYVLMGLSISQKFESELSMPKRIIMSLFLTDEIYALSATKSQKLTFSYFISLCILPYIAWVLGSLTGGLTKNFLPGSLQSALGIAIYSMFIGIIIPPAKKSKPVAICIALSALFSCILHFVPYLNTISFGFRVIIATVIAAAICALIFPVNPLIDDHSRYERENGNINVRIDKNSDCKQCDDKETEI